MRLQAHNREVQFRHRWKFEVRKTPASQLLTPLANHAAYLFPLSQFSHQARLCPERLDLLKKSIGR